ncbi:MerR family transcriptional regulator [candidate division WOR-3 bacterium]|uniref:MerR family transcriptional regulator n=1 Tax=candidate division WOR-3 bacterium TaxID=2052148 RepID=A0A9D5QD12_UNCW3|nr:MerR family transcriptional regulator [candidate division WOR-3 bacterium]MBD3363615.1 MerR family transcriptional regulator [candidate division WOR-3 bacterium]
MVEDKYYTITQAARLTGIKTHVLRYWEREFRWLKPEKNSAGRRVYSVRDVEVIKLIDWLVHKEGYSIAGARKKITTLMRLSNQLDLPLSEVRGDILDMIKRELTEIRDMLEMK